MDYVICVIINFIKTEIIKTIFYSPRARLLPLSGRHCNIAGKNAMSL